MPLKDMVGFNKEKTHRMRKLEIKIIPSPVFDLRQKYNLDSCVFRFCGMILNAFCSNF